MDRALSRWARTDRRYRRLTKRVLAAQDTMRAAISKRAWRLYLALEEAVNARDYEFVTAAIRLALLRGRRAALRPRLTARAR